jgi:hypothetical protein
MLPPVRTNEEWEAVVWDSVPLTPGRERVLLHTEVTRA